MAVPKRKQSKMKGRKRRTHYTALTPTVVKCSNCGEPKRPHHVCLSCGTYRGRQFLEPAV
ncbi:50S ribosomal protein L32 [Deltaproteobacteria bacterium Smac51]|nr:50S ribosomal protein L32 [Deltaproteobacteria bacterium Smac51]